MVKLIQSAVLALIAGAVMAMAAAFAVYQPVRAAEQCHQTIAQAAEQFGNSGDKFAVFTITSTKALDALAEAAHAPDDLAALIHDRGKIIAIGRGVNDPPGYASVGIFDVSQCIVASASPVPAGLLTDVLGDVILSVEVPRDSI